MFANEKALTTLIETDSTATEEEKKTALRAIECMEKPAVVDWRDREVVSFREAARILGYSSARSVHAAVRNRRLRGYYGGAGRTRASGVLTSSIKIALSR